MELGHSVYVAPFAAGGLRTPVTAGRAAFTDGMAATAAGQAHTTGPAACNHGACAAVMSFACQATALSNKAPSTCDCCAEVELTGALGLEQGQRSLSPSQASGQVRSAPMSLQAHVTPAYFHQHGQDALFVCTPICVVQAAVAEQQQQQQQQQQRSQPPSMMNWHSFLEETPSSGAQQFLPTSLQTAWQPSHNHARAAAGLGGQVQSWAGVTPASKDQAAAPSPWAPQSAEAAASMGRPRSCLASFLQPSLDRSHAATISQPPDQKIPFQASMSPRQAGQEAAQLVKCLPVSGSSPLPSQQNNMRRASQAVFDAASQSDEDCPTILSVFDGL